MDQVKQWNATSILQFLNDHMDDLQAMGVQKIGLFGSYIRNEQRPDSDMDFIFEMDHLTYQGWMQVWNYLEDHFACDIDLVPLDDLREEIRPQVMAEVQYAASV